MNEAKFQKIQDLRTRINYLNNQRAALESKVTAQGRAPKATPAEEGPHLLELRWAADSFNTMPRNSAHNIPASMVAKIATDLHNYYISELESAQAEYERL
jgi:hypothetical protein